MARGVSITPSGGQATSLVPVAGSIKLAYQNKDVGGNGIPLVRQSAPLKADFSVVCSSTSPTMATLEGLLNKTYKETDTAAVVNCDAAKSSSTYTFADAAIDATFDGEGVLKGNISILGNVTVT